MFAGACFREECVESIIASANGLVAGHLAIRLNAMFQAEQLPASVADLDAGLTNVDADRLTHFWMAREGKIALL